MANTEIETRPDVLGGEPVLRGTRIAARHVAELVDRGETVEAIAADLDIGFEQIEAAVTFAKDLPKAARAGARKQDVSAAG